MRGHLPSEDLVVAVVVADRRHRRGVSGQRDRGESPALAEVTTHQLCGEVLGLGRASAVAGSEHAPSSAGDRRDVRAPSFEAEGVILERRQRVAQFDEVCPRRGRRCDRRRHHGLGFTALRPVLIRPATSIVCAATFFHE